MARKQFTLAEAPHVAAIGDDQELHFVPGVYGDRYLDAYEELQEAQKALGADGAGTDGLTGTQLRALYAAIRTYLTKMMIDESADRFSRFEVAQAGQTVEVFRDKAEADAYADSLGPGT